MEEEFGDRQTAICFACSEHVERKEWKIRIGDTYKLKVDTAEPGEEER